MKFGTALYTLFFGQLIGSDSFGNRYFERKGGRYMRPQRWVMYRGVAEPSKVPPEWHAWLHHVNDTLPKDLKKPYLWQKQHQQNLTGTNGAYYPPGSILSGGKRDKATGDYQAWKP
jgi:NADH:ubiquinone oxidoreductase subunit